MLTEKDYCDLELTTMLQEVGMPIKNVVATSPHGATKWYSNVTLYEAQKWLREEKKLHIEVNLQFINEEKRWYWGYTIIYINNPNIVTIDGDFPSYENTLLEGIKEAVKILKGE